MVLSKQLCAILCISLEFAGPSQHKQLISACPGFKKCSRVHLSPLHDSLGQGPCQAGHICDICGNLGKLCRSGILRSGQVVPKERENYFLSQETVNFVFFPPIARKAWPCWPTLVRGQWVSEAPTCPPFASLCLCSARRLFCIAKDISLSPVQKGNAAHRVIISAILAALFFTMLEYS